MSFVNIIRAGLGKNRELLAVVAGNIKACIQCMTIVSWKRVVVECNK